jgi:diguanylate cyclase (GGDEF)-like protein
MINVRRILFGAPFIACIHAALILMFIFNKADNDAVSLIWRLSLVITHSIMLVLMTIAFIIALYLNRKGKSGPLARFLQAFVMIAVLSGAIAITAIDQLVTTNVTAYILIQLAVGAALLVHPAHSFVYYFVSYLAYYFFVGLNNPVSDALFSNQINGLASAVLGFLLTYIMWRQNRIRLVQSNRINEQRRELEDANRKLEKMAFFDSLTGLPNRRYFDQVLQKEISLNSRMGYDSYLIMLDVDLFKNINDMYGHPIGDELLIEIGRLLSDNIRKYDTLSRLGGEEFLLLLPQTTADEAFNVAEKLRGVLETHMFCIKDYLIHITASFGVSRLSYVSDPQLFAHYAKVDSALYLAKQSGRNCIKSA